METLGFATAGDGQGKGEVNPVETLETSLKQEPIKVGKATTIYNPCDGDVPVVSSNRKTIVAEIKSEAIQEANNRMNAAKVEGEKTGKSLKVYLTKVYDNWFDNTGGARAIEINDTKFKDKNYMVIIIL